MTSTKKLEWHAIAEHLYDNDVRHRVGKSGEYMLTDNPGEVLAFNARRVILKVVKAKRAKKAKAIKALEARKEALVNEAIKAIEDKVAREAALINDEFLKEVAPLQGDYYDKNIDVCGCILKNLEKAEEAKYEAMIAAASAFYEVKAQKARFEEKLAVIEASRDRLLKQVP